MGVIAHVHDTPGLPERYRVEPSDGEGIPSWPGELHAEELELLRP